MRWIFGSRRRKSVPTWEYISKGVIWKLLPFAQGYLVGEDRDTERKTVSFFCIDEITGIVKWSDIRCKEPWWVSMEAIQEGILILHEYAAPDMPDHKRIHAIDILSGAFIWVNDDVKFLFCRGKSLYAAKDTYEQRLFFEIELTTGKLLREMHIDEITVTRRDSEGGTNPEVIFPSILPFPFSQSEIVKGLQYTLSDFDSETLVEYIDAKENVVTAICNSVSVDPPQKKYHQALQVSDRSTGKTIYSDTVNEQLSIPVPDMFFIKKEFLYYIKEKKQLRAFRLTGDMVS